MNIIYLTKNMEYYNAAFYQKDVADEIGRQANVYFYGTGYEGFSTNDTIDDIIKKSNFATVDAIIAGHSWLNDSPNEKVICNYINIDFTKVNSIKKILILNKEYARLDEKLEYVKDKKFDFVFTHHYDVEHYEKKTGVKFIFWPFAVDHRKCNNNFPEQYTYDINFTGILQNPTHPSKQSDLRERIEEKLFKRFLSVPYKKRQEYKKLNIYWHTFGRGRLLDKISSFFQSPRLPSDVYFQHLQKSKVTISTLSPIGLIGTRYYESMLCKSLVLCEESELYGEQFVDQYNCLMFKSNLSSFKRVLEKATEDDELHKMIVDNAYKDVITKHTWKIRVLELLRYIEKVKD